MGVRFLDVKEAAQRMGRHPETIRRLIRAGRIPDVRVLDPLAARPTYLIPETRLGAARDEAPFECRILTR